MNLIDKIKRNRLNILLELLPIELLFVLFWDFALISQYSDKSNLAAITIGSILINGLFIFTVFSLFFVEKYRFNFIKFIKDKRYLFVIFLIFILCFCTILGSWLNLDGFIYYRNLREMKNWDFTSIKSLMLAGHTSQGYTIFLMLGEFLTPNNVIGVRIIHCIMALITIYCFYGIIDSIFLDRDKIEKALYTSLFALSPMMLSVIGEINTDFPLLCFLTWMVYCGIKKRYILQSFCGILLCFSKETGCILYGFYIIGIVLFRLIRNRNIKKILLPDLCLMTVGGILWIINYLASENKGWANSISQSSGADTNIKAGYKLNSVAIYKDYILQKFKQMIYINFNWILYALILAFIFYAIYKGIKFIKKKIIIEGEIMLGIVISFLSFLAYNSIYITYNHYRYLLPFSFFVSFGAVISIAVIFNKSNIRKIVSVIIIFILLASNFYTFDPISKSIFMTEGTGRSDILIPSTISLDRNNNIVINGKHDYHTTIINTSAMYNMECSHLSKCFDKTLEKINYDSDTLIIMPCEYRDSYGTTASIFGVNLAGINQYYWDTKTKQLNINCADKIDEMQNDSRYQKLNMLILNNMDELDIETFDKYKNIYYIALPFDKDFDHIKFLGDKEYDWVKSVQYISWKWNLYKIK
ncbi:MAG: hypothetical protein HDT39_01030 [Lachnospiraceae bacterium]|nr:hypothetical protein [Lachnospiraceae bacterium]